MMQSPRTPPKFIKFPLKQFNVATLSEIGRECRVYYRPHILEES